MRFINKKIMLFMTNVFLLGGIGSTIANYSTSVIQGEASPLVDSLSPKGWGSYTTNSFPAAGTEYTGTASTSSVTIGMWVFNGSTGAVRGNVNSANSANANFGDVPCLLKPPVIAKLHGLVLVFTLM